ncbi:hypothetical protein [Mycobacterium triplex]|uniref:MbtB protein n=1 Tax=Mycobacterium triplex TaxID=47839 RepID=A0A024K126_9MYCO|nr:hypothetical protein [Mycobacterium triplex]CDO89626.1 MbtB protein [Mycobacterium triplex]
MVRAPAGSEDIRAEVGELLGVGVDAVQPADNLTCQGLGPVRRMSLAGPSRRRAAGSHAAAAAKVDVVR